MSSKKGQVKEVLMKLAMRRYLSLGRCHVFVLTSFIVVASFVGCTHPASSPTPVPTPWSTPSFTYSARGGAIWQIDLDGNRTRLAAPDGMHKMGLGWSKDRAWLAYVGIQFPEPGVPIEEIFVMDRETRSVRKIAGPYRGAAYEWDDARHILFVGPDPGVGPPDPPQEVDRFRVNVETGTVVGIESEMWWTWPPPPLPEPHRLGAPNGQWPVQSIEEGSKRVFYLLDAGGNRLSAIYEQPANVSGEFIIWSSDSRWLIYIIPFDDDVYDGDLYLYDPANMASRQLTHHEEELGKPVIMSNFEWSPNSEWLLFRRWSAIAGSQLCTIHLGRDPDLSCFDDSWNIALSPYDTYIWSSDSKFVAFLEESEGGDLYVIEMASGEVRNLTNDGDSVVELYVTAY
jgi:hypothetical protein